MTTNRPARLLAVLLGYAVVAVLGSGLLDEHSDWGNPRQAAANVLWISFLLAVLAAIAVGIRLATRRRSVTRTP